MNVFKGLLYLIENDAPASPVLIEAPRYGAATAANEFAGTLGNGAAGQRRFGTRRNAPAQEAPSLGKHVDAAGGCC
ncbi:hypothetical protein [Lysobacter sp. Root494]|uniref:hypothetical protein n=1 Tax=Lysobacter sp. Root494 TaxID=1736549 RepID=UPI0006F88F0A|nr:hypothetical protein [Lysobacter sp. Root494]KQY49311.1 hypothetical protein ASD14_14680 [Lysobacter sp. Root494]